MNSIAFTFLIIALTLTAILLAVHIGFRAPRRKEKGSPADFGLAYSEVSIRTPEGKRLFAWWLSAYSNSPTIILLHGWGGNAEFMLPLAIPFQNAGLNVLLLDARNHGRSDSASFSSLPRFPKMSVQPLTGSKLSTVNSKTRLHFWGILSVLVQYFMRPHAAMIFPL